ncbi:MAG TPA: GNAT family N-acetyltransferase, partial [Dissulfurispiraceae bacterium]
LFSWTECYLDARRKPFILAVYHGRELAGVAPWCIREVDFNGLPLKRIEFLGTPESGSDYLDVFIRRGKEKEVTRCIYDFLLKEAPSLWDCFTLRDIPANSLFLLHLLNGIEEDGKYAEVRRGSYCPTVSLPKDTDAFLSGLSPNRRQQFNRHLGLLRRGHGAEHRHFLLKGGIGNAFDDFYSFYEREQKPDDRRFRTFLRQFISRCGDRDTVQVDELRSHGETIAAILHLHYRDTLSLYLMATDKGFNPRVSIGNVLVGLCIERAIRGGAATYDFLQGSEQYKFHWANGGRSAVHVSFYRKKVLPLLLFAKGVLKSTAKVILR